MSVEFLIGADPELFVRDREGKLVSAYGMIPGTKSDPYPVEGGAVQVDGMALEFNINPAKSFKEFNNNITDVLKQLKEMIPVGYSFDFSPVADFGEEFIKSQPEEAIVLGCDPDYNAYTGKENPKPNADYPFRTASGHIHIGWTNAQDINVPEHVEACQMATMQLDATLGLISRKWDHDRIRSRMYGKLGAYRPKHYGVEYRTLSNTWVNYEDRRKLVYEVAVRAMELLVGGDQIYLDYYMQDFNNYVERGKFADISYHARKMLLGKKRFNSSIIGMYDAIKSPENIEEDKTYEKSIWAMKYGSQPNVWGQNNPIFAQPLHQADAAVIIDEFNELEVLADQLADEMELDELDDFVPVALWG